MVYKILDVVRLTHDIDDENLKEGCIGTIVDILSDFPEKIYEVEFCNENGETITTLALSNHDIFIIWDGT